tara:strand:+ start:548 stop:2635 length:2088 start_codon:yes stop_codon:yes gene_type:complete
MAKKKKFQAGAVTSLDNLDSLRVMPPMKSPDMGLGSARIGDVTQLLPLLAIGAFAATPGMINKFGKDVKETPAGIVLGPQEEELLKERDRIAKEGKAGGFSAPDIKLPISTGSPLPDPIDFKPGLIPPGDPLQGETKVGGGFNPVDMPDMSIMTMGDKKPSKALVKKNMMESIDDIDTRNYSDEDIKAIRESGQNIKQQTFMNQRFSKTEDYIKSNYSGDEKKPLNDWINELYADDKGLTLELRDTGAAGALNAINSTDQTNREYSARELLDLFQSKDFPNQLKVDATSYDIIGGESNQLPQAVNNANIFLDRLTIAQPGPFSDFMERVKDMDRNYINRLNEATDSETAGMIIDERNAALLDNIDESGIPKEQIVAREEYTRFQDNFRTVKEAATRGVFTNDHISVGTPGTRTEEYIVMTHNFNPKYGQANQLPEHNTSHPTGDHTVAFSRSRLITNEAFGKEDNTGIVIMEMQSDVHRKLKQKDIAYPSEANEFKGGENFYPFGGGAQYWVKQVLKDNIENAVDQNLDFVGWNPGEVVSVYEQAADANDMKGYNTIYNAKTSEFIKKINKDIAKRGKQLNLSDAQIKSAQLVVKNDGKYEFPQNEVTRRSMYNEPTSARYVEQLGKIEGLDKYVKVGKDRNLILANMPYIDLRAEGFDIELFKKIGLPQFKKGGKTKDKMGEPLIDIEIFMKSI